MKNMIKKISIIVTLLATIMMIITPASALEYCYDLMNECNDEGKRFHFDLSDGWPWFGYGCHEHGDPYISTGVCYGYPTEDEDFDTLYY